MTEPEQNPDRTKRKTINLVIPLDLLVACWEHRAKPDDTLDDALEQALIRGLEAEGKLQKGN